GGRGEFLYLTITLQRLRAHRGELRSATALSTRLGVDHGLLEASIHGVDEEPGAAVRHAQSARRGGDRAGSRDRFEKIDLPRTYRDILASGDAQPELRARLHHRGDYCRSVSCFGG